VLPLVAGIHAFHEGAAKKAMDGRDKPDMAPNEFEFCQAALPSGNTCCFSVLSPMRNLWIIAT
jgi:hypothetical protein